MRCTRLLVIEEAGEDASRHSEASVKLDVSFRRIALGLSFSRDLPLLMPVQSLRYKALGWSHSSSSRVRRPGNALKTDGSTRLVCSRPSASFSLDGAHLGVLLRICIVPCAQSVGFAAVV